MNHIAKRIKELIEQQGISYNELERRTGVPKSALQRYATGTTATIPVARIEAIAAALGVSAEYLTGWQQENEETGDKAADFGRRLFAAHGDIAPEDFTAEDMEDIAMFLQLKKMKKDKKDGE